MNYTYMLRCSDGSLYTGWTNNIEKRVKNHNRGKGAKYTKARLPVKLAYCEKFSTSSEAMKRESKIKKLKKSEKEKLIIDFERNENMERIESFSINHLKLLPGLYVSRKDTFNDVVITTFDIRITRPNIEPVMGTAAVHAIEHIGATYLRNNSKVKENVVYFGPMGCRTGFYLILNGDYESKDIVELIKDLFNFILEFNADIPGATAIECGNYSDTNLSMAKYYSDKYLNEVLLNIKKKQLNYPK